MRDKGEYFIIIKWTIHQEDIPLIYIYAFNQGASKYIKQLFTELKGKTEKNTIIVGNLNTQLLTMNGSSKQKIKKEISTLNDIRPIGYD